MIFLRFIKFPALVLRLQRGEEAVKNCQWPGRSRQPLSLERMSGKNFLFYPPSCHMMILSLEQIVLTGLIGDTR